MEEEAEMDMAVDEEAPGQTEATSAEASQPAADEAQSVAAAPQPTAGPADLSSLEFLYSHETYNYYSDVGGQVFAQDCSGYWYYRSDGDNFHACTCGPSHVLHAATAAAGEADATAPADALADPHVANASPLVQGLVETANRVLAEQQAEQSSEAAAAAGADAEGAPQQPQSLSIPLDAEGLPLYPMGSHGKPVLPVDGRGSKVFPLGADGMPLFPVDRLTRLPIFPIGDDGQPVFPIGQHGRPIVPVDGDGRAIFPKSADGTPIFPLGADGKPCAPVTAAGAAVLPLDENGKAIVPYGADGQPLILVAADGVTPISQDEWVQQNQAHTQTMTWQQQWAQYYQMCAYQQYQTQQQSAFAAAGLGGFGGGSTGHSYAGWQNLKRVRPEDIDLPQQPFPRRYEPTRPLGDLTLGAQQSEGSQGDAAFSAATMVAAQQQSAIVDKKDATKSVIQKQMKSMARMTAFKNASQTNGDGSPGPGQPGQTVAAQAVTASGQKAQSALGEQPTASKPSIALPSASALADKRPELKEEEPKPAATTPAGRKRSLSRNSSHDSREPVGRRRRSRSASSDSRRSAGRSRSRTYSRSRSRSPRRRSGDRPVFSNQRRNDGFFNNYYRGGRGGPYQWRGGGGRGFRGGRWNQDYQDRRWGGRYGDGYRQSYGDNRRRGRSRSRSGTYSDDDKQRRRRSRSRSGSGSRSSSSSRSASDSPARKSTPPKSAEKTAAAASKERAKTPETPPKVAASAAVPIATASAAEPIGPKEPLLSNSPPHDSRSMVERPDVLVTLETGESAQFPGSCTFDTVTVPILHYGCNPESVESFKPLKGDFDSGGGIRLAQRRLQQIQDRELKESAADADGGGRGVPAPVPPPLLFDVDNGDSKWRPSFEAETIKVTVKQDVGRELASPPVAKKSPKKGRKPNVVDPELYRLREEALGSIQAAQAYIAATEQKEREQAESSDEEEDEEAAASPAEEKRKSKSHRRRRKHKRTSTAPRSKKEKRSKRKRAKKRAASESSDDESDEADTSSDYEEVVVEKKSRKRKRQKGSSKRELSGSSDERRASRHKKRKKDSKTSHKKRSRKSADVRSPPDASEPDSDSDKHGKRQRSESQRSDVADEQSGSEAPQTERKRHHRSGKRHKKHRSSKRERSLDPADITVDAQKELAKRMEETAPSRANDDSAPVDPAIEQQTHNLLQALQSKTRGNSSATQLVQQLETILSGGKESRSPPPPPPPKQARWDVADAAAPPPPPQKQRQQTASSSASQRPSYVTVGTYQTLPVAPPSRSQNQSQTDMFSR